MSKPLSLIEALATVPDPRSPKGRIHPLTAILSLTVVAILAGMKSLEAIAQFGPSLDAITAKPWPMPWASPGPSPPAKAV